MYFKLLPDLNYLKYNTNPYQGEVFRVKNLFTRSIFSKFSSRYVTIFDNYIIKDGDRADTIAYNLYGDSYYDWVIIICNERLINYYDEWPKQASDLEQYTLQKYGVNAYDVHHYETVQIKNSSGNILLPSGIEVPSDFTFSYTEGVVTYNKTGTQVRLPVTNFDYEYNENEKKRNIQLLKPEFLTLFENEMINTLSYDIKADGVLSSTLKTTEKSALPTM